MTCLFFEVDEVINLDSVGGTRRTVLLTSGVGDMQK